MRGKIQNMKSAVPVHFYIPKNSLEKGKHLPDVKKICEEGIGALWLETENRYGAGQAGKLAGSTGAAVVPVINDPALIPGILDSGAKGIAIKPAGVRELLRHGGRLSGGGICVYLRVDDNDFISAGGFSTLLEEIKTSFLALSSGGIRDISINAFHSDTVVHFNINRLLKKSLGARHVISSRTVNRLSRTVNRLSGPVSACGGEGREKEIVARSVSLGSLFYEKIGDTVLLMLPPGLPATYANLREQLDITRKTLGPLGFFPTGITVISCPTCGRCNMDLIDIAGEINSALKELEKAYTREGMKVEDTGGITVAVMGCNVNGPGEARNADLGIAGRKDGSAVIFKNGRPFKSLPEERVVDELVLHTKNLIDERLAGRSKQG